MKRTIAMSLAVIGCLLSLLVVGSAEAGPSPQMKPLILRHADQSPATGPRAEFVQKACKEVERLTEGRVKIDIYWSETLVKVREVPKALQRGVCDMGWVAASYNPADIPLWTHFEKILYFPKGGDAGWMGRKAWELFDRSKELRGDFEKMKLTNWFFCPYDAYVLFSKKMVKTLADMKGMRIRVSGEGWSKMVNAIGGHATFIPLGDTYSALERGTVDAGSAPWSTGKGFALYEVVPYVIEKDTFGGYAFILVSLSALAKMSEQDRKTFLEVGRRVSLEYGEGLKKEKEDYKAFMRGKGLKILPFPAEERDKWAEVPAVKILFKNWIDEQNAAGRPGTVVARTFLETFEFEMSRFMPPGY